MWGESAPGCTLLTALQHRPGSKAPNSCKTHSLMAHSVIQSASRIMLCKDSCINPSLYSVTNPEQKYTNLNSFKWILCVKINVLPIVFNIKSDYSSRLTHWMLLKPLKIHQIQITAAVPTKKKSDMDLICHIMFHLHNQQPPLNINATTNVNAQLQETCAHTVTVDMRDLMLIHPPVPIILRNIA